MPCGSAIGGIVAGSALGALLLAGLGTSLAIILLHHVEKKERRALERAETTHQNLVEQTVVVENKGAVAGTAGVAEVVTTGPSGTTVSTVPTAVGGAAVVSTAAAGIPGGVVSVEPGQKAIVTSEHPVGEPSKSVIVGTTKVPATEPTPGPTTAKTIRRATHTAT